MSRTPRIAACVSVGTLITAILWACANAGSPPPSTQAATATATLAATPSPSETYLPLIETEAATPTPTSTPSVPSDVPILPPGGPGAATNLQSTTECSTDQPREGIAHLSWTLARNPGEAQRVDVTIVRDGFERGDFQSSPTLTPDESSFAWQPTSPGLIHAWRALTLHSDGWVPSETGTFQGATCVADFVTPAP